MYEMRDEPLEVAGVLHVPVTSLARHAEMTRQSAWAATRAGRVRWRYIGREIWIRADDAAELVQSRGRAVPTAWRVADPIDPEELEAQRAEALAREERRRAEDEEFRDRLEANEQNREIARLHAQAEVLRETRSGGL